MVLPDHLCLIYTILKHACALQLWSGRSHLVMTILDFYCHWVTITSLIHKQLLPYDQCHSSVDRMHGERSFSLEPSRDKCREECYSEMLLMYYKQHPFPDTHIIGRPAFKHVLANVKSKHYHGQHKTTLIKIPDLCHVLNNPTGINKNPSNQIEDITKIPLSNDSLLSVAHLL